MARKPKPTHSYTDNTRGIRLQKAMANAGIASRRECETFIENGRVTVNSERVTQLPAWVDPFEDRVEVDGEPLIKPKKASKKFATAGKLYLMVHKPRGVLSTNDDPEGRRRIIDLIDPSAMPHGSRLFPVGRLDADSTGLILMTNDGELTHRLTHPSFGVNKRYLVSAKGRLEEDDLRKLRKGLVLSEQRAGKADSQRGGKKASMESVQIVRHETDRTRGDRTTLRITLTEGQNREIRRLLARVGIRVKKLKRTGLGPIRLKGLAPGEWRMLSKQEVGALRRAVKLKGTKPTGEKKTGGDAPYVSEKPKASRGWSTSND
ncbi:MAG: pseudouridine synthase [Planctomycetota bacterium]